MPRRYCRRFSIGFISGEQGGKAGSVSLSGPCNLVSFVESNVLIADRNRRLSFEREAADPGRLRNELACEVPVACSAESIF